MTRKPKPITKESMDEVFKLAEVLTIGETPKERSYAFIQLANIFLEYHPIQIRLAQLASVSIYLQKEGRKKEAHQMYTDARKDICSPDFYKYFPQPIDAGILDIGVIG
jgi:hypothetical protein